MDLFCGKIPSNYSEIRWSATAAMLLLLLMMMTAVVANNTICLAVALSSIGVCSQISPRYYYYYYFARSTFILLCVYVNTRKIGHLQRHNIIIIKSSSSFS